MPHLPVWESERGVQDAPDSGGPTSPHTVRTRTHTLPLPVWESERGVQDVLDSGQVQRVTPNLLSGGHIGSLSPPLLGHPQLPDWPMWSNEGCGHLG